MHATSSLSFGHAYFVRRWVRHTTRVRQLQQTPRRRGSRRSTTAREILPRTYRGRCNSPIKTSVMHLTIVVQGFNNNNKFDQYTPQKSFSVPQSSFNFPSFLQGFDRSNESGAKAIDQPTVQRTDFNSSVSPSSSPLTTAND